MAIATKGAPIPDISLIIPTYGRYEELEKLLQSIAKQDYPLEKIEVIIIDQNDSIDLSSIIAVSSSVLNIVHYKTDIKGIARAKNTGIHLSKGNIISFPDDDCLYYNDTISRALDFFTNNPEADIVYGRVFDRTTGENIMRNWPNKDLELNRYNFHLNYYAITCFTRQKELVFDNRFGAGTSYASGEELDYIINALEKKYTVLYTNSIDVWHPRLDLSVMPLQKIFGYARGYGAICRKNLSSPIFFLFFKSLM